MTFQIPVFLRWILFGVGCSGFLFLRDNSGKGSLRVEAFRASNVMSHKWVVQLLDMCCPNWSSPSAHRFRYPPYPSLLLSSFTFRDPLLDVLPRAEKVLHDDRRLLHIYSIFQERRYYFLLIWGHLGASVKWSYMATLSPFSLPFYTSGRIGADSQCIAGDRAPGGQGTLYIYWAT